MSGIISGYGPKNISTREREPKVNLSFASKLPKADLKDPLGMKTYLSVLTQVLPAISGPKHEEMRNLNMSCDMAPAGYNRKMTPSEHQVYDQTGHAPGEPSAKQN